MKRTRERTTISIAFGSMRAAAIWDISNPTGAPASAPKPVSINTSLEPVAYGHGEGPGTVGDLRHLEITDLCAVEGGCLAADRRGGGMAGEQQGVARSLWPRRLQCPPEAWGGG